MNKDRRKQIDEAIKKIEGMTEAFGDLKAKIEEVKTDIETIRDEEQEYMDNMPESLQSSDKYYAAEAAISNLESALEPLSELESAMEADFESIVTNLDAAKE